MRRTSVLALALLCACATATKPPAEKAAEQTAPAADPFAGCVARSVTPTGFVLQCGTRVASLDKATQVTPESVLESYFAGMKSVMNGELRRSPIERVVGGQPRRGLSLALHVEGQPAALWSGEALAWTDQDGTTRLVSCGASNDADRALCASTYEALATANGLPQGITPPEQKQIANWPPALPAGCTAGPQNTETNFHAVCPDTGANLVLMRLGDEAAPEKLSGSLEALSVQTLEALKTGGSPGVTMESTQCVVAGAPSACTLYVFPKDEELTLVMLMGMGNTKGSAVVAQCYFPLEAGVPPECEPWVTVAE